MRITGVKLEPTVLLAVKHSRSKNPYLHAVITL